MARDYDDKIDCPYCSETIKKKAKKCKHCGEIVDAQMRDIEALKRDRSSSQVFMNSGSAASSASSSSGGDDDLVLVSPGVSPLLVKYNHWLHVIISILTGGIWIPVYILLYLFRNKNVYL